ncbi:Hypothetical predicted protein [Cloeon dipterum]|uniref:BRCA1-associated ATM activator 1 n=1 Tax=Cloeon dipterum TaxID=197152 RepID=A0A8S1DFD9_9INSE|nr:Hypothetical predicted protein [Cloeon dipterum]
MAVDVKLQLKLKTLLTKFMVHDHEVIDDTCLEKLLTQLSKDEYSAELLDIQECRAFCECALQSFEKGAIGDTLLSFSLRLHGLVIKNEQTFSLVEVRESTERITSSPRWIVTNNVSIQFSFVQMVSFLLGHNAGVTFLENSDIWRTVKKLYEKNSSIYVSRECQTFLKNFIMKASPSKRDLCSEILQGALDTLESNKTDLNAAADLLISVLEETLRENKPGVCALVRQRLKQICSDLLSIANLDKVVLLKVAKLELLLLFCAVQPTDEALQALEHDSLELIRRLVVLKAVATVQALTAHCQIYWKIVQPRVQCVHRKYSYDVQIVYVQLMPVMKNKNDDIDIKDAIKNFLENLCCCTSSETQVVGCYFRKLCFSQSDHQKIACRSIHSLLQLKDVLERTTSLKVFRALMCIVVQLVSSNNNEIIEIQESGLMKTALEALIKMMDHFHFTWTESFETVEILHYMQDLLCETALEDQQICLILQIMRRAVEDFLPPNLALLTNTLEGNLQNLGPQLYKCLQSSSWEVRDSALEVVAVVAKISIDKFPAFQDHLIQHSLCGQVVSMAQGDSDGYVRSSALKCLSTMVAVPHYWDRCLKEQNVPHLLTTILCQDSEGLVRHPAAALATAMLQYDRLKSDEKENLYLVMASAAATDLHWEVKVGALLFWETVMKQQLTAQGMIDGKFPDVTFSSTTRRIVTLDKREVQSRLQQVLNELSRVRCLSVLLSALDDPDLHVVRKAAEIVKHFLLQLDEHGLLVKGTNSEQQNDAIPQEKPVTKEMASSRASDSDVTMESANSNSVIDGIVGASDLSLLAAVCRTQLQVSEMQPAAPQQVLLVSADDFLKAAGAMDVDQIVSCKEDWLFRTHDHLESLLTDMLEAREFQHNTNDMDCY